MDRLAGSELKGHVSGFGVGAKVLQEEFSSWKSIGADRAGEWRNLLHKSRR